MCGKNERWYKCDKASSTRLCNGTITWTAGHGQEGAASVVVIDKGVLYRSRSQRESNGDRSKRGYGGRTDCEEVDDKRML